MVTFRFYVVTTVALFLALAVGIVVGSALDERLVAGLESQVARVQGNLDDTIASIDAKNRQIDELEQYVDDSAPFAVDGTLPDTSVLVVAEEGVDAAPVEDLVRRLRQGGAHTDGIVWVHPRWSLGDVADRDALTASLELEGGSAATIRTAAWTTLLGQTAERTGVARPGGVGATTSTTDGGASAGEATTTNAPASTAEPTTTEPTSTGDPTSTTGVDGIVEPLDLFAVPALQAVDELGLVRLQRVDGDGPTTGANLAVVLVTGQRADTEPPASLVEALAATTGDLGLPTVVAEVFAAPGDGEDHDRGSTLETWRTGEQGTVSTVDDLDLLAGRVATVLALADLREGVSGHYGYGPGADRVLPEWLGP